MMKIELATENELLVWKLQETMTIQEAVLLMCGILPEGENVNIIAHKQSCDWPKGVLPLVRLLTNAVSNGKVAGQIVQYDNYNAEVNIAESTLDVASLVKFLRQKSVVDNFFNNAPAPQAEYLNTANPFYAPKLAAAVMAWEAITQNEENARKPGSPKQKMETWLRQNASRFGLTKPDGKLNEEGIKEICKVANWQPLGGAAQTPVAKPVKDALSAEPAITIPRVTLTPPTPSKPKRINEDSPFDDDIPF